MENLKIKIGLEIHVQLKSKSKMFCRCDNEAFGAKPNTTVCPVCLGMPGTLPVANKQAVLWTIKTGLALNCTINKIAKFDRKHYFYPDLPKGYQISQYDEPFCSGGYLELSDVISNGREKSHVPEDLSPSSNPPTGGLGMGRDDNIRKIRLNRIHLEEDAGKLIHSNGKSLVDLNRAGTPLMEIVTEPDIASPKEAGEFLRKLQKIVRDVVSVSEASMEKGHMRCDANISVNQKPKTKNQKPKMSQIIELKNINSFKFVEKALVLAEEKLKAEFENWPEKLIKETWGYDSKNNNIYQQRVKEEASDYRYFPDPDLPPFDTSRFDLEALKAEINDDESSKIEKIISDGISESDAKILAASSIKLNIYYEILEHFSDKPLVAKAIVHNYFGFQFKEGELAKASDYAKVVEALSEGRIQKHNFAEIALQIHRNGVTFEEAFSQFSGESGKINLDEIVDKIILANPKEVTAYKAGRTQLLGFFMGQVMREAKGKADPGEANKILCEKLKNG